MRFGRVKGTVGGAVAGLLAAAGLREAAAVDDEFYANLGEDIRGTVLDAVNSEGADDGGSDDGGVSGGESENSTEALTLDDSPGASIADASGGNSNVSFVS